MKIKDKIINFLTRIRIFIFNDFEEYEPLQKCNKAFWGSAIGFMLTVFGLIVSLFKYFSLADIIPTLLLLCVMIAIISIVSGCEMIRKLNDEEIKSEIITVIKAKRINLIGTIEAVTQEEENYEFILESDIKIKKNRKYKIYYYERRGDKVITYAKQISKNEKRKERKGIDEEQQE